MELPVLRIGLLGFERAEAALAAVQITSAAVPSSSWQVVPFEDADLWLINSLRVSLAQQRGLHIANPDAPHSPLTIYPHQTSRPIAFTQPLPSDLDAVLSIDLGNGYQCASGLGEFANALAQLCAHFALGEQVASRQSNLRKGTYHLQFDSRLVAVVDLKSWQVALLPGARALDLALASWRHRPDNLVHMPSGFEVHSLERLMWVFASRTKSPRLPDSYLTELIHLRQLSTLPQSWLHQDHMSLIGLLSQNPHLLGNLSKLARLPLSRLEACLAALYYSGTITTDPRQIIVGDRRVHSGYVDLPTAAHGAIEQEHSAGQSVFDTHSFAPVSIHN